MRECLIVFTSTFILLSLLIPSVSLAAAEFSAGVSPSIVELGELERGSTNIVKFYLVTPSSEPFLVYLESENGRLDFFERSNYNKFVYNYSEERPKSWVEFLKNPVEIRPANESLKTKAGTIEGWREINFLVNVPEEAEPGYHLLSIKPVPTLPSETLGEAGAKVVAITSINILFKVPGEANREGIILDVVPGDYTGRRMEIKTYFKNTGTTTISSRAFQEIFNNGDIINITSSRKMVGPGETEILKSFLPLDGFSEGEYTISTTVDYTTNSTSKISKVDIYETAIPALEPEKRIEIPVWLIILVVIIITGIVVYRLIE